MKKITITTALIFIVSIGAMAQVVKTDTIANKLDTIPAYIRIATGVSKGNLMGTWVKGYFVKIKGKSIYMYDDSFQPYYIDSKKKRITAPVVQSYH